MRRLLRIDFGNKILQHKIFFTYTMTINEGFITEFMHRNMIVSSLHIDVSLGEFPGFR